MQRQTQRRTLLILNADTDRAEYSGDNLANILHGVFFEHEGFRREYTLVTANAHMHQLPDTDEHFDGVVITGSGTNVLPGAPDSASWVGELLDYAHHVTDAGIPVLGVCFGAQLLSSAHGGVVEPIGVYEDGTTRYEFGFPEIHLTPEGIKHSLFGGFNKDFRANESHRNRVMHLPDGGVLLAENDVGIQAFSIGESVLGVQFHAEIYSSASLRSLRRRLSTANGEYRQSIENAIARIPEEYALGEDNSALRVYTNFIEQYLMR